MSSIDPKLSVVFDAIRDALQRVADDDIIPRLEALDRERAEDRSDAQRRADAERGDAVHAAVASAVADTRAALLAQLDAERADLREESAALAAARHLAEASAAEARGHAASLTEQVNYLQSRLGDLDAMWRAAAAERDGIAQHAATERQQADAQVGRLAHALAHLDGCTTLIQCLDALCAALSGVSPRSAVLLPRGPVWQLWGASGFEAAEQASAAKPQFAAPLPREAFEGTAGPLAAPLNADTGGDTLPFVLPSALEPGSLWPLTIGDAVTVIVYADRGVGTASPPETTAAWTTMVERVIAQARLAIECVTASQLLRSAGVVLHHGVTRASA